MKNQVISFDVPVNIFQIYRNVFFYTKSEKSFDDRKKEFEWRTIQSKSDYVKNGEVYLNERVLNNPDLKSCNLITIEDKKERNFHHNGTYSKIQLPEKYLEYNSCLNLINSVNIYDFTISNNGGLELHLLPSSANVEPKRTAFKLCNINENEPIEVRLNSKFDSSGSRYTERTFIELQYIFIYLGKFDHCTILKYPFEPIEKHLPVNTKMIDLLKPLW